MNRVQKGNKSFKPVAKNRARPSLSASDPPHNLPGESQPNASATSTSSRPDPGPEPLSISSQPRVLPKAPNPIPVAPPVPISTPHPSIEPPSVTRTVSPEAFRESPPRIAPSVIPTPSSSYDPRIPRIAGSSPTNQSIAPPGESENTRTVRGEQDIALKASVITLPQPISRPETPVTLPTQNKKRKRSHHLPSDSEGTGPSKSARSKSRRPRKDSTRASSRSKTPNERQDDPLFLDSESEGNATEEEEVDPLMKTMATLCSNTSEGKPSTKADEIRANFAAWKARNKEKRAQMRASMERKKQGLPEETVEPTISITTQATHEKEDQAPVSSGSAPAAPIDDPEVDFDYTELTANKYNVQVRIGPNGETIIDEESLVVDRTEPEDTANYTHVVESDATKFTNSATYGRKLRGSRWSTEETDLFYNALAQYGQNFELIACILPGRDRKACKNKFKAEDKKNPARITHFLKNSIPVDVPTLSRMTGRDFSGPVPEIRVPERPAPIPVAPPPEELAASKSTSSKRKRKGSARTVDSGDVQVIGSADTFDPFPDDS